MFSEGVQKFPRHTLANFLNWYVLTGSSSHNKLRNWFFCVILKVNVTREAFGVIFNNPLPSTPLCIYTSVIWFFLSFLGHYLLKQLCSFYFVSSYVFLGHLGCRKSLVKQKLLKLWLLTSSELGTWIERFLFRRKDAYQPLLFEPIWWPRHFFFWYCLVNK